MASRSHVDVSERRLRPIYDCLDNGNNKKAIQEADKVLKKQKDLHCAKVLKGLALLRLGRHDESTCLLEEVHTLHPTDENTLQAMAICYRETQRLNQIASMYENAHKSSPNNEEIQTALFMAYVRLGNYKKQQQVAMLLHKLRPHKNPYYFWAIMSIVMQAHTAQDPKLAKGMFLPLAERMTQKYVEQGKIEAEAEVQMYLIILDLQEKWEVSLNLLQSDIGKHLVSELNIRENKIASLLVKLERVTEAGAMYKELLQKDPDQWSYWQNYFDVAFQLFSENSKQDENKCESRIDDTVEKVYLFIKSCKGKTADGRPLHGPFLAEMEFYKRLKENNCNLDDFDSPGLFLQEYFRLYGDKLSCSSDLRPYLLLIDEEKRHEFIDDLKQQLPLRNDDGSILYSENIKLMQRHITVLQFSRIMGSDDSLTKAEKINLYQELVNRYQNGLPFGTALLSTDVQFADPYLLHAVGILLDLWKETGDCCWAWQTIFHLEKGIHNSPSNFQMKLLIVQLYCAMGAFGPCPNLYDGMEIKHIMNDTLGHIVTNHVVRLGHFVAACAMYGSMLRFFTVNHKETTEYLIASYKYGTFSKIYEFVKFRERLENSLQYATATAERLLLDLVLETNSHSSTEKFLSYMEIDPETDKTVFEDLRDNRDFILLKTFDPPSRCTIQEIQDRSFQEEKAWLKIRNLTLRILAAAVMIGQEACQSGHAKNGIQTEKKSMREVLETLFKELSKHIDSCTAFSVQNKYPIQGPFRTRISTYLSSDHWKLFKDMVENVLFLNSLLETGWNNENAGQSAAKHVNISIVETADEMVFKQTATLDLSMKTATTMNGDIIENYVQLAESLSHATILVGVCHRLLKPLRNLWTKKNKRRKDSTKPVPIVFESFNQLVNGLQMTVEGLHRSTMGLLPLLKSEKPSESSTDARNECVPITEPEKTIENQDENASLANVVIAENDQTSDNVETESNPDIIKSKDTSNPAGDDDSDNSCDENPEFQNEISNQTIEKSCGVISDEVNCQSESRNSGKILDTTKDDQAKCEVSEQTASATSDQTSFESVVDLDFPKLNLNNSQASAEDEDEALEREVWQHVEQSYRQTSRELSDLLHNKLSYLEGLRL